MTIDTIMIIYTIRIIDIRVTINSIGVIDSLVIIYIIEIIEIIGLFIKSFIIKEGLKS